MLRARLVVATIVQFLVVVAQASQGWRILTYHFIHRHAVIAVALLRLLAHGATLVSLSVMMCPGPKRRELLPFTLFFGAPERFDQRVLLAQVLVNPTVGCELASADGASMMLKCHNESLVWGGVRVAGRVDRSGQTQLGGGAACGDEAVVHRETGARGREGETALVRNRSRSGPEWRWRGLVGRDRLEVVRVMGRTQVVAQTAKRLKGAGATRGDTTIDLFAVVAIAHVVFHLVAVWKDAEAAGAFERRIGGGNEGEDVLGLLVGMGRRRSRRRQRSRRRWELKGRRELGRRGTVRRSVG